MPLDHSPKTRSKASRLDKPVACRTLSDPTLSPKRELALSADVTAAISRCIANSFADENTLSTLVTKLAPLLSVAVNEHLTLALEQANKKIEELHSEVHTLKEKLLEQGDRFERQQDDLSQYSRRNCLRVFGVKETDGENTDGIVVDILREKLNLDVQLHDIDRSHRVGPRTTTNSTQRSRPRAIIVKFLSYRTRREVFSNKKKLKGTNITIREDLTKARLAAYKAVSSFGMANVWTLDGRVHWVDEAGRRHVATAERDVPDPATPRRTT